MQAITINIGGSEGVYKASEIFMLGLITIAGFFWQVYTFKKDSEDGETPFRVKAAIIICIIAFVGVLVHDLLAIADPKNKLTVGGLLANAGKSLILFTSFIVKSLFGPATTTITLLIGVFHLYQYDVFLEWNFISALFDWLFINLPNWAEALYFLVLIIVSLGGTIIDNFQLSNKLL